MLIKNKGQIIGDCILNIGNNKNLSKLKNDEQYLIDALDGFHNLWEEQFNSIDEIKYVMFSESPLWGDDKSYLYNINTKLTQFFYKSDLEFALNKPNTINNKSELLAQLREIGFIIVDISPFALSTKNTSLNYRSLSKDDYQYLVKQTATDFLIPILKMIHSKASFKVKYFFRYDRVLKLFKDLIGDILIRENMINDKDILVEISKQGGSIDKCKLYNLLN